MIFTTVSFWQRITQDILDFLEYVQVAFRGRPFTVISQPVTLPVQRNWQKKPDTAAFLLARPWLYEMNTSSFSSEKLMFSCLPAAFIYTKKTRKSVNSCDEPLTSPLQVQTWGNWNHLSDPQHTPVLTHFLTGVNQPLSVPPPPPPLSHCGALGCWEGEDGTWDFRHATMTAGISEKPQPVWLWACASVQSAQGWMLSSRQKNESNAQCKKNILKRNSYFLQFKCTFDSVLYLGKQHFHSIKRDFSVQIINFSSIFSLLLALVWSLPTEGKYLALKLLYSPLGSSASFSLVLIVRSR